MYLWIEFDGVATVLNRPIEIDLLLSQSDIAIARAQTDAIRERIIESGPEVSRPFVSTIAPEIPRPGAT